MATRERKPIRGLLDGCFDLVHSGHFNAIRQGASLCDELVVSIIADEEIHKVKGPTVLNDDERASIIKACKWVDVIEPRTPYYVDEALIDKYNCDFYIHGDDPVMQDGVNTLDLLEKAGKFKYIKRTTGISTTDITSRLLCLVQQNQSTTKSETTNPVFSDGSEDSNYTLGTKHDYNDPPKQQFL